MTDDTPTVTRDGNGFLTLNWPTDWPNQTTVAREVLTQMIDDLNKLRTAGEALIKVINSHPHLLLLDSVDSALRAWEKLSD